MYPQSTNSVEKTENLPAKSKLESYLASYSKKWIQDFKMRPEIIKFLEENIGESSLSLVMAKFRVFLFLIWQQKHRQEKEKSVGLHQIKKIL